MQWIVLLTVLTALVSAEHVPHEPVAMGPQRLALAVIGVAVVAMFARLAAGATVVGLRGDSARHEVVLKRFSLLCRLHTGLWLAVVLLILFGLDWAQLVRGNWALGKTFLADDLLMVAPVLVPLILSWAAFYDVDRTWHMVLADMTGRLPREQSRARYVSLHIRHYLGLVLAPLLLVLVIHDGLQWLAPHWVSQPTQPTWLLLLPLVVVGAVIPWLLRYLWETEPLPPGPLRERLLLVQRTFGVRTRDILVWRSDGRVVNAAVAGLLPRWRFVFLSDGLLARLSNEQIAAVFTHEIGHIRHRHLALRLLALLLPVSLWQAVTHALPQLPFSAAGTLAAAGLYGLGVVELMCLVGVVTYMATFFAWYSRALELEADLCAAGLLFDRKGHEETSSVLPQADQFVDALRVLANAGGAAVRRGGLLHPPIDRRISFVRQAVSDPATAARYRRLLRSVAWLLVGLTALAVASALSMPDLLILELID